MELNCHKIITVKTSPYKDQNPGTSGLRKKVTHFQQENYLQNFIQSIFDAHAKSDYLNKTLVIGGDGRFYNDVATDIAIKMAAANGIREVIVAENGAMSTPAISLLVRHQKSGDCFGAILLTASHNPGGPLEDWGIKFNNAAGAPAPENVTAEIFERSKLISSFNILDYSDHVSLQNNSKIKVQSQEGEVRDFTVTIESTTSLYVEAMQKLFDFEKLKTLISRKDFKFTFDAMHGASGPYAVEIFNQLLGVDNTLLHNCDNLEDFGGLHPDPNLVYAKNLVNVMDTHDLRPGDETVPDFGAACDGDADRNMILGRRFFISPSDSLAMIVSNFKDVPSLNRQGGLVGVARSMPTSGALDRVANKMGIKCYETPTGWKFFGNLMDSGLINICGEESFGTGSDHIREKDGMWAVLAWLSILAEKNYGNQGQLIGLRDIALEHWKQYGRDYYCRFDYEALSTEESKLVIENLNSNFAYFNKLKEGNKAVIFEYTDPVDHSVSKNQGWIFSFADGSRTIFRVSGTSSSGATIRIYFEKHVNPEDNLEADVVETIKSADNNLIDLALKLSKINEVTGRTGPTVIT